MQHFVYSSVFESLVEECFCNKAKEIIDQAFNKLKEPDNKKHDKSRVILGLTLVMLKNLRMSE